MGKGGERCLSFASWTHMWYMKSINDKERNEVERRETGMSMKYLSITEKEMGWRGREGRRGRGGSYVCLMNSLM